jgi:hypothetical protein
MQIIAFHPIWYLFIQLVYYSNSTIVLTIKRQQMYLAKLVLAIIFTTAIVFGESVPTIHQVYQAAEAGNLNGAHQMIEQVLKAHPESAKAHYVNAEILVRQGDLSNAKSELSYAEKLQPGLPFAKPQAVQNLKQHLQSSTNTQMLPNPIGTTQPNNHSIPWTMILLGVGALLLIWLAIRAFTSRNTNYPTQYNSGGNGGNPNNSYGSNPGFGSAQPYPQQNSGLGGGIMSGLATGAAAGVGFVAGEELMHHFMDEPSASTRDISNNTPIVNNEPAYDMGGDDFGLEDSTSWDNSSSDTMSDSGDNTW